MPACSSDTLTNVLPHRNAMLQTQDMTPYPITVYRHRADLSLCYPLMWNVTLGYTFTHFTVLGQSGKSFPDLPTHQWTLNIMILVWWSSWFTRVWIEWIVTALHILNKESAQGRVWSLAIPGNLWCILIEIIRMIPTSSTRPLFNSGPFFLVWVRETEIY